MNPRANIKALLEETPVENICEVLDGSLVYKPNRFRRKGDVHIITSNHHDRHDIDFSDSVVVMSDDLSLQRHVVENGASCLILAGVDII